MTVLKRRHRREDSDYDEVEVASSLRTWACVAARLPGMATATRRRPRDALGRGSSTGLRFRRGLAERRRRKCPVRSAASLLWTLAWSSA